MLLKENFSKIKYNLKRYGMFFTLKKIGKRVFRLPDKRKSNIEIYKQWIIENETDINKTEKLSYEPKISVVVPMYNTDEKFFKELIDCMKNQTYSKWELCLADGSSDENDSLKEYFKGEKRVKYKFLGKNNGISGNTNEAIAMATGKYIGFLDHDDLLAKNALYEIVRELNKDKKLEFIYTDEDKIDQNGERFEPHFKPDFSPETLECNNYITHFVVIKKELQKKIGLLDSRFNGAQDFDFVLRATENTTKIKHIPKILYHWRVHRDSTANVADSKPYAYESGLRASQAHLMRTGKKGLVDDGHDVPGIYKIYYEITGNPKVSILIPSKDNKLFLKTCINSIINKTDYQNYEIVIIENGSKKKETFKYYDSLSHNPKIKILKYESDDKEFNYSKLINFGVKNVDGEFVLQLNNDTRIINKDWLELLIGYAQNKEIGAVGGRLYYIDKSIQHAGIIVGLSGIAGNMLVKLPYGKHAYFGQESATRNVSAVTGACLFARRELYKEVGFMDEKDFKVAFNDVDFCLKLIKKGYRIVYNPYVELFHYESKTRGYELSEEKKKRFENECNIFKEKWGEYVDPYYNINFSLDSCNYDIKIKGENNVRK